MIRWEVEGGGVNPRGPWSVPRWSSFIFIICGEKELIKLTFDWARLRIKCRIHVCGVVNIGYIGSRTWFQLKFNRTKFSAEQIRFPLLTFRHWLTNLGRLHDSLRVGVYTGSSKTSWSLSVFYFLHPVYVWFGFKHQTE